LDRPDAVFVTTGENLETCKSESTIELLIKDAVVHIRGHLAPSRSWVLGNARAHVPLPSKEVVDEIHADEIQPPCGQASEVRGEERREAARTTEDARIAILTRSCD
jgi:hypothetical protein